MCTKYCHSAKIKVLFELMFKVPVNSLGHVGTLPLFYGTFTQHDDDKCLKYNHPTKPQKAYTYGWFDMNHFSWAGSDQSG